MVRPSSDPNKNDQDASEVSEDLPLNWPGNASNAALGAARLRVELESVIKTLLLDNGALRRHTERMREDNHVFSGSCPSATAERILDYGPWDATVSIKDILLLVRDASALQHIASSVNDPSNTFWAPYRHLYQQVPTSMATEFFDLLVDDLYRAAMLLD